MIESIKNKKIILSGGAGFIGHHLLNKLAIHNMVYVIDNLKRGVSRRFDDNKNIFFHEIDITNLDQMIALNQEADIFIHLAAINGTENFYQRPIEVMDVGVLGVINVFKYCSQMSIPKVVVASSAEVYQKPKILPTPEDIELIVPSHSNPRYSYGLSKIFTEFYSLHYGVQKDLSVSIFRPHNVYGEDMGYKHVIPEFILPFIKAKLANETSVLIKTKGPIDSSRAFCYVSDIVDGIEAIAGQNTSGVFNIGNPASINIKDILLMLSDITDLELQIDDSANEHPGSVTDRIPDISKIEELGFLPKINFLEGLTKTYDWYLNNYHLYQEERKNTYL
jgi:UDP-glucose 4-epimerase|tara:strand:+ start:746 stop:1750 length:1005 start_codon:yes stop_codon:yes gene_type:complete